MGDFTIGVRSVARRAALVVVAVAALGTALLGAKWQLGDMLAATTEPGDELAVIRADAALVLAPDDPRANAFRSELGDAPGDAGFSTGLAEKAVRLAPLDHRWRIMLARVLADSGRPDEAEREFRRAIELAPAYAACRWYYGNFLLRQGRGDEALAEFTRAASDPLYRSQVLGLVWDYTREVATIERIAGDGPENLAYLAAFLANHDRPAEAMAAWDRLPDEEKRSRSAEAHAISAALIGKHRFNTALYFAHAAGDDPDAKPEAVTNASFESSIDPGEQASFGWHIVRNDPKLDLAVDDKVAHDGRRSLRLTFRGSARPEIFNASQTVAVSPGARYRLTFWLRTENLRAASPPFIDVATGDEAKSLGRTQPFPNGTNEWRQMLVEFAVPADADGIEIRTLRSGCNGDDCPVTGILWYDDLVLTRL